MNHCTKEQLIAFENRVKALWENGDLPYLIHLCGGNEDQLIEIFKEIQPGDWVFSGHRNHYHALLSGMDPEVLLEKIKRGDSMFVYGKAATEPQSHREVNFLTSAILASMTCIAAGVAWKLKEDFQKLFPPLQNKPSRLPHVWCFLGDGAEDEGHFYEAVRFVNGHQLPCTFIVEDNDRSVDTDKRARRGGHVSELDGCVKRYFYTPTYPHAGSGCKHNIVFKVPAAPAKP